MIEATVDRAAVDEVVARFGHLLLYDGRCRLCDRVVGLVLGHDPRGAMRFATLDGVWGDAVRAAFPSVVGIDSVVVVDADGAHCRSEAVLRIFGYLGGWWRPLTALRLLPRPLRDLGYRFIARTRYGLFGRLDACRIPEPLVRDRFLD